MPIVKLPLLRVHRLLRDPTAFFNVTQGRDVRGRPLPSVQTPDYVIEAGVQPAGNDVVKMLPEGQQKDGALVVHAEQFLFIASAESGDVQTYLRRADGSVWKCWKQQNWNPHSHIGKWYFTKYIDLTEGIT